MYEHQNSIAEMKSDAELGLKQTADEAAAREQRLLVEQRALRQQLKEQVGPYSSLNKLHFAQCRSQ